MTSWSHPWERRNARIAQGRLRAEQHHDVGVTREWRPRRDEDEVDARLHPERVHVVEVGDPREPRGHDPDSFPRPPGRPLTGTVEDHRVLGRKPSGRVEPGDDPPAGPAGMALDVTHAVVEERRIAPELVDREASHHRRVGRFEHRPGSRERRDDPAPVDVREEADRDSRAPGEAHVRDVAVPEVRLRRAPRPLDDHEIEGTREAIEALEHRDEEAVAPREVVGGFEGRDRPSVHHHLRGPIGLGLEQHRVHVHRRGEPGRAGLEGLGPADLAPPGARRGVVRHVLRLERGDGDPAPACDPAEPGHDCRLPDIRAGALEHERPAPHAALPASPSGRRDRPELPGSSPGFMCGCTPGPDNALAGLPKRRSDTEMAGGRTAECPVFGRPTVIRTRSRSSP